MCILHIVFCTVCKYVLSICKLLCFFGGVFLHCLEHARNKSDFILFYLNSVVCLQPKHIKKRSSLWEALWIVGISSETGGLEWVGFGDTSGAYRHQRCIPHTGKSKQWPWISGCDEQDFTRLWMISRDVTWFWVVSRDVKRLWRVSGDVKRLWRASGDVTCLVTISWDMTWLVKITRDWAWVWMISCDVVWVWMTSWDEKRFWKICGDVIWLGTISCDVTRLWQISRDLMRLWVNSCDVTRL